MSKMVQEVKQTADLFGNADIGDWITAGIGLSLGYGIDMGIGVRERIADRLKNIQFLDLDQQTADMYGTAIAMLIYLGILGYGLKEARGTMKYASVGFAIGGLVAEVF